LSVLVLWSYVRVTVLRSLLPCVWQVRAQTRSGGISTDCSRFDWFNCLFSVHRRFCLL